MDFVNDDGDNTCPLCMEEMDLTDRQLKPCKCGYEICVWCWHHVMEVAEKDNTEGRCPACRTPYDKEKIVGMTVSRERLADINSEKKQKSQKGKAKASEVRKHLSNVRVIQRNLVYIVGIPANLAVEETLERREFFGQYGKVLKVSISRSTNNSQHSSNSPTASVYITYVKEEEATRCIQAVNGYVLDGRPLRACFGTTKYCHAWLKNMPCNNPECLYLHDIGTQEDSFTKEEMVSTCASKIPQFHGLTNPLQRRWGNCLPPPEAEVSSTNTASSSKPLVKVTASNSGGQPRATLANGTTGKTTVLPAAASWGLRVAHGGTLPVKASAVPASSKLKSSPSHPLSVSPPSNLPTSAAVVAAAAATPGLHSDQSKPSLVIMGGHATQSSEWSVCYVSNKQNVVKNHQATRADSSCIDASVTVATSENFPSRQGSPVKKHSGSIPYAKSGVHEGIERPSHSSWQNLAMLELPVERKRSDYGVSGRLCQDDTLTTAAHNHDDTTASEGNENIRIFSTSIHGNKRSLDTSTSCASLSQNNSNSYLETSITESMKEICITGSKDTSLSNESGEQTSEPIVQMLPELGIKTRQRFAFDDKKELCASQISPSVVEECSPCDAAISTGSSLAASWNDRHLSTISLKGTSICETVNGDDYRTGISDHRIENASCASGSKVTTHSAKISVHDSDKAKEDGSLRIVVQTNAEFNNSETSDGQSKIAKLEHLESLHNDTPCNGSDTDTDIGESSIISNILSMNFDILEDNSLASPHYLAKALLGEKDAIPGFSKEISSSWKSQSNGQSRFSFARQDESGSNHYSTSSSTSNGHLPKTWSKERAFLDGINGYDQGELQIYSNSNTSCSPSNAPEMSLNRRVHFKCVEQQQQSFMNLLRCLILGQLVIPPSVSRAQISVPPGFSVPTRTPPVPPPGFFPQLRVDRPYESSATAVFPNGNPVLDNSVPLQNAYLNAYNQHQTLGNSSSNDVEFIDPAIMAVGRGKSPMGVNQTGSAAPDSFFNGTHQELSNSNFGQSLLGFRPPFSQQVSSTDYDARLQILKQRSYYATANLAASRQQSKFPDHIGDTFAAYLSCQSDTMHASRMLEQAQANFDSPFSQISFQQAVNSTLRGSAAGANGWDEWNRTSSALESGFVGRRLESSLIELANKERLGLLDPKVGLNKMFPTYDDSKFHIPSSDDYYSRTFDM